MSKPNPVKVILKGVFKGLVYYTIYYVVIFGLIITYVIPTLISSINLDINVSSIIEYNYINIYLLVWFIVLYIVLEFIKTYIPYGVALEPIINIALLYIVLLNLNFGRIKKEIPEYNASIFIDASKLFTSLFMILVLLSVGSIFSRLANEYKKRHKAIKHTYMKAVKQS